MTQERTGHTMTVLRDGRVLVTGGSANFHSPTLDSAELYDPLTGTWSPTASMHEARAYHTATRLPDGRVLVAGGSRSSQCGSQGCSRTNDVVEPAEIYDPTTGQWTEVGGMPAPRQNQAATLLDDGTVLIEGGGRLIGLSSAQLFDPATSAWRETGSMRAFRNEPSATLLADGRVFVVGGQIRVHQTDEAIPAEIFDPATSSWTATSASPIPIGYATATLLRDGKVLVVGPTGIELYDPSANAWSSILNGKGRVYHMAIGLPDGTVLVAGGIYDSVLNSTAIYNPGGLP